MREYFSQIIHINRYFEFWIVDCVLWKSPSVKNSTKIDRDPLFCFDPKMDLVLGPESVTIFIKSCLRRRSGIFTHFSLQGAETRRLAKHILFDESPARMTHSETFLNWLQNQAASEHFPINGAVRDFSTLYCGRCICKGGASTCYTN